MQKRCYSWGWDQGSASGRRGILFSGREKEQGTFGHKPRGREADWSSHMGWPQLFLLRSGG